jgi:hypothetical protein
VVDFIPGHNPQKDRLGPDRTPIVVLEAARRTLVSGATFPVRRQVRFVAPAVAGRARRKLAGLRPTPPAAAADPGHAVAVAAGDGAAVAELELDASVRRFLAAVTGHHSPDAMAGRWAEGDSWWRVGEGPLALARVGAANGDGAGRPVRELVLFEAADDRVEELVAALAGGLEGPLAAPGVSVGRALLPWPARDADPWRGAR